MLHSIKAFLGLHKLGQLTVAPVDGFELTVCAGSMSGSSKVLKPLCTQSIGNRLDCDIYLADLSDSEHRMELVLGRGDAQISLLEGAATLNGNPMILGNQYQWNSNALLAWADIQLKLDTILPAHDIRAAAPEKSTVQLGTSILAKPVLLCVFLTCGVLGSVMAAFSSGDNELQTRTMNPVSIETQQQHALHQATLTRSEPIVVKKAVAEDIADSVRSVFRTHGLQADLSILAPGRVVVRTRTNNLNKLASAESAAKADVYGLTELNVINTRPKPSESTKKKPVAKQDPSQAIRLVMVGNPSYIITEDRSRYMTGSVLPTGHQIEAILLDKVVLSKDGVSTELNI